MCRHQVVLFDIDETLVHAGGSGAGPGSGRSRNSLTSRPTSVRTLGPVQSIQSSPPETLRGVLQREPRVDDLGRLYARCLHYLAEDLWESSGYRALPSAEATLVALGDAGAT